MCMTPADLRHKSIRILAVRQGRSAVSFLVMLSYPRHEPSQVTGNLTQTSLIFDRHPDNFVRSEYTTKSDYDHRVAWQRLPRHMQQPKSLQKRGTNCSGFARRGDFAYLGVLCLRRWHKCAHMQHLLMKIGCSATFFCNCAFHVITSRVFQAID